MSSFVKLLSHNVAPVSTYPVETRSGYFIGVSKTL
ncbi:hypothetical protein PQZ60_gp78 [Klebsiella phage vB_KpnM_FZ14]|nr:hypothetical protein PQZ60_gp78 [Klebsiella phage vB_KpnM_FZ14]